MNLKEAAKQGVSRLSKQDWAQDTYLRINPVEGGYGPWARLFDRQTQEDCGFDTPQAILIWNFDGEADFIPYTGIIDKDNL